ncbi:MAG: efflux RND transporter periplasmic adaptor subunit [Pseudomonadota bacterium]
MRLLFIVLALGMLGGLLWYLYTAEYTLEAVEADDPRPAPWVSIETVQPGSAVVEVMAFAEVRPRWSAELKAAVSGRITSVTTAALAGERVEEGTVLIEIERATYVAELAAAELSLKEAKLRLWQAQNAHLVARKEFERERVKPPNDLALRLPQLAIAESAVASAEARVSAARRQLEDATLIAPFAGFVTARYVSPGQTANAGDPLVKLVDDASFEMTVELSRHDWSLLKTPLAGLSASVIDQNAEVVATATIRQGGGFLDETTRQYKVFLEITGPESEKVLSGDFVRVALPGITVPNALEVPASALTQEGEIWHVDASSRLTRFTPTILFRRQDRLVIEAPAGTDTLYVAITPLASFLPGQSVQPY